jgi:uncharacterized damage-inducible protein DinB
MMPLPLPEPGACTDPATLFAHYLDFYREKVIEKVAGLDPVEQRNTRLPSGWSPLELIQHLAFMERRWLVWGFLAEQVDDPWGDSRDGRWHVDPGETIESVAMRLRAVGERTRGILAQAELAASAATGGRFPPGSEPPTLLAILFHVLQEYARHAGQLDVARELADGATGE